jgi:hypothetical protein
MKSPALPPDKLRAYRIEVPAHSWVAHGAVGGNSATPGIGTRLEDRARRPAECARGLIALVSGTRHD